MATLSYNGISGLISWGLVGARDASGKLACRVVLGVLGVSTSEVCILFSSRRASRSVLVAFRNFLGDVSLIFLRWDAWLVPWSDPQSAIFCPWLICS